ncbi:MAG: YchJ family protein [Candidatus Promineifilaceae bacterium]
MKKQSNTACPCQSGASYAACCEVYHRGQLADSAEKLMRSRYCAFAKGKVSYLIKTTHPQGASFEQNTIQWRKSLKAHCKSTQFVGLQILGKRDDSPTTATVTFHASLMRNGQDVSFTEKSKFEKVQGRWLYLEPSDLKIEKPW